MKIGTTVPTLSWGFSVWDCFNPFLFIITDSARGRGKEGHWEGVGVMKDKEIKLDEIQACGLIDHKTNVWCTTDSLTRHRVVDSGVRYRDYSPQHILIRSVAINTDPSSFFVGPSPSKKLDFFYKQREGVFRYVKWQIQKSWLRQTDIYMYIQRERTSKLLQKCVHNLHNLSQKSFLLGKLIATSNPKKIGRTGSGRWTVITPKQ